MLNNFIPLGFYPTPLHRLNRLSARFDNEYNLYMKRDDQTGLAIGGNKVRKLEYLVKDALDKGCDTLVTFGAVQSNHCRQTAAAAAQAGLECHLILRGSPLKDLTGNLLLDKLLGAHIHWEKENEEHDLTLEELGSELEALSKKPYLIPIGGSNPVGSLGYARAISEFKQQMEEADLQMDYIVFASCSGGTHAGMILGKELHHLSSEIMGIAIEKDEIGNVPFKEQILEILNGAIPLVGLDKTFTKEDIILMEGYNDAPYAVVTEMEINAISTLAKTEGIILDPVYSGRAFAGFLDLLEKRKFPNGSNILFWHTGGTPALFHYAESFQ